MTTTTSNNSEDPSLKRYRDSLLKEHTKQASRIPRALIDSLETNRKTHRAYFQSHALHQLPAPYASQHQNLLTFVYFGLSALDVLSGEDDFLEQEQRLELIEWVYSLQVQQGAGKAALIGGFRGSHKMPPHLANLAMTYTALCCLRILGDDLQRVNKEAVFALLADAQHENGSFQPTGRSYGTSETDVRFVYCACAICTLLEDWNAPNVDWDATTHYLLQCRSYDGAFGHTPHSESHGGSTYCIVSSLFLMQRLHRVHRLEDLTHWLLMRQQSGFQGRPNKPADTCYSFWIGSSLRILNAIHLIDATMCAQFTINCQCEDIGGFGKHADAYPDILHSYMGLCGLSLVEFPGLKELYPALGLTARAAHGIKNLPKLPKPVKHTIFHSLR